MQQQVQFAEFFANRFKDRGDLVVLADITWQNQCLRAECTCQFLDVFFQPFALVSKRQRRSGFMPGLGNGPGDRSLVGHPEHDSVFAVE